MRLLVLNVDRDDDLGRKTGIRGPTIGREATLAAATALAVADPEEADANGMFAAIKEYDEIKQNLEAYGADEVFVAAATGHIREGSQADAAMAHQIDEILATTGADHVILVSDGGEDEHIVPILQTRAKVDGIRRVIVKQARNLEGALYLFNRLMNDEKLQRRFFLPLAFLFVAAGIAILQKQPEIFVAAMLFLAAFYIFVQVFNWQEPIGSLFTRISSELRAGKLSFFSSVVALVLVLWGGFRTLETIEQGENYTMARYTIVFFHTVFWWVVGAGLAVLAGRALDDLARHQQIRPGYWKAAMFTLGGSILAYAVLSAVRDYYFEDVPLASVLNLDFFTLFNFAAFFLVLGLIARRYFARAAQPETPRAPPPTDVGGK